jgi:DNA-binding SARP family transcriptional activator
VRYEVLGQVQVRREGALLDLGPSQRRVILSVLLVQANRPISREQLIDAVWGEELPKYAANLAQKHISALRRQLEPGRPGRTPSKVLVWTDAGYLLTVPPGDLDLQLYEDEVTRARRARARGDLRAAAEALHRALRQFSGQPFDGLFSPMLQAHRDRLVEQRIGLVEDRLELDLALGVDSDLVSEIRQLASDHPLRDRLSGLLMLALYRDGHRVEALSAFQEVRRRLRHDLGVDPPAFLETLHRHILAGDPVADLLSKPIHPASSTVGRERRYSAPRKVDVTTPHPARVHDYLLGGIHNFAADRELGERLRRLMPGIDRVARLNEAFLRRSFLFLAESGIRQFIDLGSGIPALGHPYQVLRDRAKADYRFVYVDYDPVSIAYSALLFEPNEGTALIQASLRDIDGVLDNDTTGSILDLGQPIGLIMPMMHFIPDSWDPAALIAGYRDRVVSGSYLVLANVSAEVELPGLAETIDLYQRTWYSVSPRTHAQVMKMCAGFELVPPGLVCYADWRPEAPGDQCSDPAINSLVWAGIGRKS